MNTSPRTSTPPDADARRRAVARALGRAPTFLRYAARYAPSPEDAEDAYQQAMEIALQSAPSDEPRRFDAWFYAVVRNEARAAARRRRREAPDASADLAGSDRTVAADARRPDVIAEWRERHADVKEALSGLSETQRSCLILRTAGLGHEQIAELTGRPLRQVERAISRGRARVIEWETAVASGAACERLRAAIDHVARGGGRPVDRRRVANHVGRCAPCRRVLAARRRLDPQLVALVPAALLPSVALPTGDVSLLAGYLDRLTAAGGARVAQVSQLAMDLPAMGAGRLGAKGLALVAAAAAGLPFVTAQVDAPPPPEPVVVTAPRTPASAPPARRSVPASPVSESTPVPAPPPELPPDPAPPGPAPDPAPTIRPPATPPAVPPADADPARGPAAGPVAAPVPPPAPVRVAASRSAPPAGTAAAEFGP